MLPSRGPDFSFSRIKIHVFGHKLDTLCSTRTDPILAFHDLKSVFKVKNSLYAPSRGPDFSLSRLKIHVIGHKLDTLCSSRADPILAFHALKSVFKVKH